MHFLYFLKLTLTYHHVMDLLRHASIKITAHRHTHAYTCLQRKEKTIYKLRLSLESARSLASAWTTLGRRQFGGCWLAPGWFFSIFSGSLVYLANTSFLNISKCLRLTLFCRSRQAGRLLRVCRPQWTVNVGDSTLNLQPATYIS